MNTTVRIVLKLIPDSLQTQPVFLCVDDTMVSKFGHKIEMFQTVDHAAHNRFQLSEWTLLCECHALRTCLEWG